jgi:hypothetical protein
MRLLFAERTNGQEELLALLGKRQQLCDVPVEKD